MDIPDAEHVVERAVGRVIELCVAVGAAVGGVQPSAYRLSAPFLCGHGEGPEEDVQERGSRGEMVLRCQELDSEVVEDAPGAKLGLDPIKDRRGRVQGKLRA